MVPRVEVDKGGVGGEVNAGAGGDQYGEALAVQGVA